VETIIWLDCSKLIFEMKDYTCFRMTKVRSIW